MTSKDIRTSARGRASSGGAQAFVILAITVIAAAVGYGTHVQLGAGPGVSAGLAGATFTLLVALHAICGAVLGSAARAEELAGVDSAAHPRTSGAPRSGARVAAPLATASAQDAAPRMAASSGGHAQLPEHIQAPGEALEVPSAGRPLPAPAVGGGSDFTEEELGHAALKEFWTFRPSDPVLDAPGPGIELAAQRHDLTPRDDAQDQHAAPPALQSSRPQPRPAMTEPGQQSPRSSSGRVPPRSSDPPPGALREADVEMIQGLIKKLADQVNAADAGEGTTATAGEPGAPRPQTQHRPLQARNREPLPPALPAPGVERSLEALRLTADAMRDAAERGQDLTHATDLPPSMAPPPHVTATGAPLDSAPFAPPPVSQSLSQSLGQSLSQSLSQSHGQVSAVADAVHSGRFDVMLEPIMGLGDLRASHYEVSLRLTDAAGGTLAVDQGDPRLAGASLLPLLDRTRLERAAAVARRLAERGKAGSVFSDLSGEALTDDVFMSSAAGNGESIRRPGQLVLTFAQGDLRIASEAQLRSLGELSGMGFRFGLAGVTDLDMDFETLVAAGFAFVKLDADVFLEGLRAAHGVIPARDICGHLGGLGLTLVVDRIDSEHERSRLHGFGVTLGQGSLFGGPRPMKADALAAARHAAA